MKTAIVIADTHKNKQTLIKIKQEIVSADYVIHLGDYVGDIGFLKKQISGELIRVRGNGDVGSFAPSELVKEIEGVRLFITHGHRYGVKRTLQNLGMKALAEGCSVALYGHTHLSSVKQFGEVLLLNPGSFYRPNTGVFSYMVLKFWKGRVMHTLKELY